jgi:polysaccharide export outer membrane protein
MYSQPLQRASWGLSALVLLAASGICLAQGAPPDPPSGASPSAHPLNSVTTPQSDAAYKIGVGDVLHVTVWEEPQFTEVAIVRPDGMISVPLISDITVLGMTPQAAEAILTERLLKFVHKPRVTVTVQEIRSRMVYITGEVERPGAYPLIGSMNVVQLVSRSGGLTDFAKKNRVYVLRKGSGARINIDYRKVLKGQSPEQNVELAPGDIVVVP